MYVDIYSISALSSTKVEIESGTGSRIQILVTMGNSAGVFQIEKVLERKIRTSSLQNVVEVKVWGKEYRQKNRKVMGNTLVH